MISIANNLTTDIGLEWYTVLFLKDGIATIEGNEIGVERANVKFTLNTNALEYDESLTVCMTAEASAKYFYYDQLPEANKDELEQLIISDNGDSVAMGEYQINNELSAECIGYGNIDVIVTIESIDCGEEEGGGAEGISVCCSMCYEFSYCEGGNIFYDPFVYYEGMILFAL